MKEFVEKMICRLEESKERYEDVAFMELGNSGHTFDYEFAEGKKEAMGESISIVNQLAEEYNNGWIPCSERLPEKYGEYLCCDTYGNFVLGFPSESNTSNTGFVVETEHEYCYDIIAWMELPAPFKKGSDV